MPLELFTLLCSVALAGTEPSGAPSAPVEELSCPQLLEKLDGLDSERQRRFDIRELNLKFIAHLEEGRESQRIKAGSSLAIAERRIQRIDTEKGQTLGAIQASACKIPE